MSKLLSEEQIESAYIKWFKENGHKYFITDGFTTFKAAFNLLMPIIEKQNEALNYYGNRMGMGGTARQAIQETKQMLEKQLEEVK